MKIAGDAPLGLGDKRVVEATDEEGRMLAADILAIETADRKNAVESYVYNMRGKASQGGELSQFLTEFDKDAFLK